jgi:hypothetical protein
MQSAVREVETLMSPASVRPVGVEGAMKEALATSCDKSPRFSSGKTPYLSELQVEKSG